MSTPAGTDGLVVVHVRDQVNRTLAGHDGREYTSPPHQRTDALILVALLLGRPAQPNGNGEEQSQLELPARRRAAHDHARPSPLPTATRCPNGPAMTTHPRTAGPRLRPPPRRALHQGIDAPVPRAGAGGARGDHRQRRPRATRRPRSPRGAAGNSRQALTRDDPARRRAESRAATRLTDRRPLRGGLVHRITQPHWR